MSRKRIVLGGMACGAVVSVMSMIAAVAVDASSAKPIVQSEQPNSPSASSPGPELKDLTAASPTDDVMPAVALRIFDLGENSGFSGQRTDYPNRSITVYWSGDIPAAVQEFAALKPSQTILRDNRPQRGNDKLLKVHQLRTD